MPDAPNSGLSRFPNRVANILGPSVIALGDHCVNFRGEKMAGQAGWYRAPGEAGMLRYWNGTMWTDHRQPDPAAAPQGPPRLLVEDPDPMAEYERQFQSPSAFDPPSFDPPSFDLDQRHLEGSTPIADAIMQAPTPAPQPQYRRQAALAPAPAPEFAGAPASVPRSFAPRPAPTEPTSLGPIALGPAAAVPIALPAAVEPTPTIVEPQSEFEQVFSESQTIAEAPKAAAHREPLAVEAHAPSAVGVAPNRTAVLAAVRGMGIALLVILIGIGAMAFFNAQSLAGAGEIKTTGIVTSLGSTTGNSCTPIARFAVKGRSLTANSNTAITPCPVGLGQDVDVIYAAADPASAARIQLGTSLTQYLWLIPLLGGLFFLASLTTFVVRAGSIVAGIRLIRDGGKRSKEPVSAA
jgi:hypothetical protein